MKWLICVKLREKRLNLIYLSLNIKLIDRVPKVIHKLHTVGYMPHICLLYSRFGCHSASKGAVFIINDQSLRTRVYTNLPDGPLAPIPWNMCSLELFFGLHAALSILLVRLALMTEHCQVCSRGVRKRVTLNVCNLPLATVNHTFVI